MKYQLRTKLNRFKLITVILLPSDLLALSSTAEAHRDGCHRWHSCPSDSGSYMCGDLGYTSECPSSTPVVVRPAQTTSAPVVPVRPKSPISANLTTAKVNDDLVRFRNSSSTEGKVLFWLEKGTKVNLGECGANWCAVRYLGVSGYMMKKYLTR